MILEYLRRLVAPFVEAVGADNDRLRAQLGRLQSARVRAATFADPREAEFGVFSQWGEDGILQYLIGKVPIADRSFIEFGVESYAESNTRFLLVNDGWRGLILDGGDAHRRFVARRGLDWRHELTAVQAFVTRENVNELFARAGFTGDVGLLSIDIDGNDYWVWEAIEAVTPRIVVCEYNSVFGPELAVSVPYEAAFDRARYHQSRLGYGASLAALAHLARRKGYRLVAGNSAGNNAFFVREDCASDLHEQSPREAWVESRFRESRGPAGELTLISSHRERLHELRDRPLVDVRTGKVAPVRDLFGV